MSIIGYAGMSTKEQLPEAQEAELRPAGLSNRVAARPKWRECLGCLREGDTLPGAPSGAARRQRADGAVFAQLRVDTIRENMTERLLSARSTAGPDGRSKDDGRFTPPPRELRMSARLAGRG